MNDIAFLITVTHTFDDIGNDVKEQNKRQIFCDVKSSSQKEFFEAAQNGMKSEKRIKMWKDEYQGEKLVEIENKLYSVYRTFEDNDYIELYLETRAGVI